MEKNISFIHQCKLKYSSRFYPLLFFFIFGCAEQEEEFSEKKVNDLYNIAMNRFDAKEYRSAATAFNEVERQHPYSDWALQAELMAGYCYYLAKKYNEAIEQFEGFCELHPGHKKVPYALYMIGICNYEQILIVQRDQQPTEEAKKAFLEIIERFGQTSYAKDAKFKIHMIEDHLAAKEMDIGRQYQSNGGQLKSNIAAINRYQNVIKDYARTSQVPEALYRLVECHISEGLIDDAKVYAAVLGDNYLSNVWYQKAYELLKPYQSDDRNIKKHKQKSLHNGCKEEKKDKQNLSLLKK
jgi:outer membrane protein assembly factor BamD